MKKRHELKLEDYKPAKPGMDKADWLFDNHWITYDQLKLAEAALERRDRDAYRARAIPRLAAIDALSKRIDFTSMGWRNTADGERWQRLMNEQGADEHASGI